MVEQRPREPQHKWPAKRLYCVLQMLGSVSTNSKWPHWRSKVGGS